LVTEKHTSLKFVTIADTHCQHRSLKLPGGDVLIHAGDLSMKGSRDEVEVFLNWFAEQDFQHKIFIAGNHDFFFERAEDAIIQLVLPAGIIYLNDNFTIINGLKIWGSPITPWFYDWAFNRERGEEIQQHWDLIPADSDIIVTHGPVFNRLDQTRKGDHVGCEDLLRKVQEVKPKVHVCGHIHEAYGRIDKDGTTFINASVVNSLYELTNSAVEFEL
jgi:Icc-related predicted phosphoesterase